ncbi:DUF4376 domain-containing protein [Rhizobium sp. Leaf383]|uniref:DUF4376 domain-containing protein n=1 Tax=Rhizobium sp. Leaf383 TaxID=1736357 RepID=UPI000712542B|nr:DUF4376 domain-containing protein [Rhizobium sp. Leaf383]KQS74520.1 hypothetical protein ASG58_16280 [Rhizobium sp. Leaf383]
MSDVLEGGTIAPPPAPPVADADAPEPTPGELWFVVYHPLTGAILQHGNAFGEEDYQLQVEAFPEPNIVSPIRLQPINAYFVDVAVPEIVHRPEGEPVALSSNDVDRERDRRIAAGFTFHGNLYQAREQDIRNINGAATGAALALMQGAQPGDLRWQGGEADFGWIAADNAIVPMDVVTMVNFGRAAMAHVERLTMTGRSLKDRLAAGEALDIADDALWSA